MAVNSLIIWRLRIELRVKRFNPASVLNPSNSTGLKLELCNANIFDTTLGHGQNALF